MVRRLVITRQHLSAAPTPTMLDVIRDLGCLQLDPTSAVARSHLLVLWSRLGGYDVAELDRLLWQERSLFEYWAHAASIVLTEDYPVHRLLMDRTTISSSAWSQRVRQWVDDNRTLHDHILAEVKQRGALPSKHFEDKSSDSWYSSGWTSNRNVSQMLGHLWDRGTIMVAARKGGHRYWDLAERVLPDWTPRESLTPHEVTRRAAQKSLRALGVGQARHIVQHYTRSRYHNLPAVLAELEAEKLVERVAITDKGQHWPGDWYIHTEELPLLERLEAGDWQPRTTLLSPFDNLICDRARTELLFDFEFRIEIYVPKNKRKYGYYVLPILHGDQLIGRIDPLMNRKQQKLMVNAIYAEPDAPKTRTAARAVQQAIESLADFLGAKMVDYTERIPAAWKPVFRRS
jgi:uncharacterized protein